MCWQVQEDIARKVADNLELRITAETDSRFASRRSKSADRVTGYVLARAHSSRQDGESLARAVDLYRESLKADPSFALAKVWLAHASSASAISARSRSRSWHRDRDRCWQMC